MATKPSDDEIPLAADEDIVEVGGAAPVSKDFEQAPDTNVDLFGNTLAAPPDTTARELAPKILDAAGAEIKVVVGDAGAPPAPAAAPQARPPSQEAPKPKFKPKLLGRQIVEKKR